MLRWRPQEVTFAGTRPQSAWELQTLLPEKAERLDGTSGPLERLEHQADGVLHLGVRIKTDRTVVRYTNPTGGPISSSPRRALLS